jgi:tRNA(Ile)-lysidine synthase
VQGLIQPGSGRRLAPLAATSSGAERAGAEILQRASAAFDRRLDPASPAPVAVGFSGGGDSLALLLAARAWTARTGRSLVVLTVDHGINPRSQGWTAHAGELATRLGADFRALEWTGDKPRTGLQAAARRARHALMAAAARDAGASVVLLGHTRDDLREAHWMRGHGSSVGVPREWAPSPVWPEGRGVFLLRPLLGLGRPELRDLLAPSGLGWIEDPANDDDRFLRTHARRCASGEPPEPDAPDPEPVFAVDAAGAVGLPRDAGRRLLAMACVSAGGGERLARRAHLDRLTQRLAAGEAFAATLAGARIEASDRILVVRDAGRADAAPQPLPLGRPLVWDGRFEITAFRPGLVVRPLSGAMSRMEKRSRSELGAFSPEARASLPAVMDADGSVTCPILAQSAWSSVRTLVRDRLEAACGRIAREPALAHGSHGGQGAGALS